MSPSVITYLFLCFALCSGTDIEANLRYYVNDFYRFVELPLSRAYQIFTLPWHNSTRNTVIYCHGFTGKPTGPSVTEVIKTYLEQGESNVALLNWEYLASDIGGLVSSYVNWAVPNGIQLGMDFADALSNFSKAGLDLQTTHLIGHSLGAHIFGIAGNSLMRRGIRLPWITGLDPAGIGFDNKPAFLRLCPQSAEFVKVIHTDPDKYGTKLSIGTIDFWPNFRSVKLVQPGCKSRPSKRFSKEDLCNHHRSWQLLVSAIKYPNSLVGSYAKNYRAWKKSGNRKDILAIDSNDRFARPGNYYLVTNSTDPYGLYDAGM